jgi:hypothetical protein
MTITSIAHRRAQIERREKRERLLELMQSAVRSQDWPLLAECREQIRELDRGEVYHASQAASSS